MKYTIMIACLLSASCATVYGMENNNTLNSKDNDLEVQQQETAPLRQANNNTHQSCANKASDLCWKGLAISGISLAATVVGVTLYNIANETITGLSNKE